MFRSILGARSLLDSSSLFNTQIRSAWTKAKKKRYERYDRNQKLLKEGKPKSPPPNYLSKSTPVLQPKPRPIPSDAQVAAEIASRSTAEILRHQMTGLVNPDSRVGQLLKLKNGSQRQVVAAQKHAGMALFQRRPADTGSSAVQVVALTARIQQLMTHMRAHHKDKHSKRGLDALYVRRRKMLDYMERKEYADYVKVVKTLGLVR